MAYQSSPALSDWTSSSHSPMLPYGKSQNHSNSPSGYIPLHEQPGLNSDQSQSPALHKVQTIQKLRHYNNIFSQIIGLISVGLTLSMDGILAYVLYKYYSTRYIAAPEANPPRTSPWANDTQLWPAFLLLASSTVTFIIDFISLIAGCMSRGSKRAAKVESSMTIASSVAFAVKWIAVAVLYRIGKTTKDLWGWSCDERAKKIQQFYVTDLNFERLCAEQSYSWYMSIGEWVIKAILLLVTVGLSWKAKRINKHH